MTSPLLDLAAAYLGRMRTMQSYMEVIYIDTDDQARHTDVGAAMDSDDATRAAFQSYRYLDVGKERARFLLDYHDADGDLDDTICLDAEGFTAITGQSPKTDAAYRRIDARYWAQARAARARRAGAALRAHAIKDGICG